VSRASRTVECRLVLRTGRQETPGWGTDGGCVARRERYLPILLLNDRCYLLRLRQIDSGRPLGDGASTRPVWFPSGRAGFTLREGAMLRPASRRVLRLLLSPLTSNRVGDSCYPSPLRRGPLCPGERTKRQRSGRRIGAFTDVSHGCTKLFHWTLFAARRRFYAQQRATISSSRRASITASDKPDK
jgi:hypothetical protein